MKRVKEEIIARLEQGKSFNQIAREVGCSKSTVSFHSNRMGHRPIKNSSVNQPDWEAVQHYHDEGHSGRECAEHFGFGKTAWTTAVKRGDIVARDWMIPLEDLLVSNRPQTSRKHLKRRLLKAGLLVNTCYICGISEWLGKNLILELDHINGKNTDNRLENLRLLCPNCHSQTMTYCNKVDLEEQA